MDLLIHSYIPQHLFNYSIGIPRKIKRRGMLLKSPSLQSIEFVSPSSFFVRNDFRNNSTCLCKTRIIPAFLGFFLEKNDWNAKFAFLCNSLWIIKKSKSAFLLYSSPQGSYITVSSPLEHFIKPDFNF